MCKDLENFSERCLIFVDAPYDSFLLLNGDLIKSFLNRLLILGSYSTSVLLLLYLLLQYYGCEEIRMIRISFDILTI